MFPKLRIVLAKELIENNLFSITKKVNVLTSDPQILSRWEPPNVMECYRSTSGHTVCSFLIWVLFYPTVQASIGANTWVVSGTPQTKSMILSFFNLMLADLFTFFTEGWLFDWTAIVFQNCRTFFRESSINWVCTILYAFWRLICFTFISMLLALYNLLYVSVSDTWSSDIGIALRHFFLGVKI